MPRSTSASTTSNTAWRPRSWGWPSTSRPPAPRPDELLGAVRVDALAAVKADLALRALVEAEELTLSDEELLAEIVTMAERMGTTPTELAPPTRHGRADRRGTLGAA